MAGKDGAPARLAEQGHDHQRCVTEALETAEALCAGRGVRLTKLRRRVLELVWTSHAPIGAYDVLRRLSQEHEGAAPPTVYRALDFLLAQGLIHRIESLNAFIGCAHPAEAHTSQFLICRDCGAAAELQDASINRALARSAGNLGFLVMDRTVELRGLCAHCRPAEA